MHAPRTRDLHAASGKTFVRAEVDENARASSKRNESGAALNKDPLSQFRESVRADRVQMELDGHKSIGSAFLVSECDFASSYWSVLILQNKMKTSYVFCRQFFHHVRYIGFRGPNSAIQEYMTLSTCDLRCIRFWLVFSWWEIFILK